MTARYARQIVLPAVGEAGQAKLASSSVLVVGAGGLGCPVLQYLAGAGVGHLTIVDHDRVDESNLHRQPLYRTTDIGQLKAEAARKALEVLNPSVVVDALALYLDPAAAKDLVRGADGIVDAADSIAVTYNLSDICKAAGKPLISASCVGLKGYVGAFCAGAPSYRSVFPDIPQNLGSCATLGVLGSVVGVLGGLQAQMVLALILGLDPSPLGQLVSVDLQKLEFGGFSFLDAPEAAGFAPPFIAPSDVNADDIVFELRSMDEVPVSPFPQARRATADTIVELSRDVAGSSRIVLCCRSGLRAWRAASLLRDQGHQKLALIAMGDIGEVCTQRV
ncbi:HesA/MoeB/ThiF family protein [Microvirga lotononidis]|uniref:Dinucleotide-utilizing enzyme possibly involved in molybdopterin or thiamin biosynthesis n=1 Tax=Microvirga lotononidis TaxID=864069 RepID=I4Z3Y3_9HYPH|nr:HesA/MoeB/ThiF family protein [Microvirga lotononidis]EIM30925.1 dinucleotide-utilizing enzyme possibly involved in molybdopterin or thiamin biosynthesis [Microvirga lotononidis]WQO30156.1 HesA/MoeB/ThiF family protein [Microvirga lotononidis]